MEPIDNGEKFIMGCWLLSISNIISLQYEYFAPTRACQNVLILKESDAVYGTVCVLESLVVGYAVWNSVGRKRNISVCRKSDAGMQSFSENTSSRRNLYSLVLV